MKYFIRAYDANHVKLQELLIPESIVAKLSYYKDLSTLKVGTPYSFSSDDGLQWCIEVEEDSELDTLKHYGNLDYPYKTPITFREEIRNILKDGVEIPFVLGICNY